MKKVFTISAAILLLIGMLSNAIGQEPKVVLEIETVGDSYGYDASASITSVGPSQNLWISVYAKDLTDLVGYTVRIEYMKDYFEYANVSNVGSITDSGTLETLEVSPINPTTPVAEVLINDPSDSTKAFHFGGALQTGTATIGSDYAFLGRFVVTSKSTFTTSTEAQFFLSSTEFVFDDDISVEVPLDPDSGFGCAVNGALVPGYVVPVELMSFEAVSLTNNEVELRWQTASETNNLRFDIMRSSDGDNFEKIGSVPGHGTTNEVHSYSFIDRDVNSGDYYYRLKQVDIDGTTVETEKQHVNIPYPEKYELGDNYPNPFNPSTSIPFSLRDAGTVKITVYNIIGQEIKVVTNRQFTAGVHHVLFNGRGMATGVYFYRLEVNGLSFIKKFALIK